MRYKLLIFIFVSVLFSAQSMAQKVIDTAYMKCQYKYSYSKDTITGQRSDDLLVLQIGHKVSKCYSHYTAMSDSIHALPDGKKIFHQQMRQAIYTNTEPPHKRMRAYVYKNYPNGQMTVTDGISSQDYIYVDSLDLQNWVIKDSLKTIMGYSVQMAECDFRGRHWTAWFTEDIPVNNGPWKLGNLPGLIMEAYSDGMQNHFVINGLEKTASEPIVFSKSYTGNRKFERTTRKKFLRQNMKYLCDINGYIFLETGIDFGSDKKQNVLRYDLLECDYKK